jgi:hypothetical protein
MATIAEVEKLAQDLSENDRAVLAAHLLGSLPPVLYDEDDGIAESLRRDAELEANHPPVSRWSSLITRLSAVEPDAPRPTSEGLFRYRRVVKNSTPEQSSAKGSRQ